MSHTAAVNSTMPTHTPNSGIATTVRIQSVRLTADDATVAIAHSSSCKRRISGAGISPS